MSDAEPLPEHIEASIQAITKLHADHEQRATPFQRKIEWITDLLGQPVCLGFIAFTIAVWIGANVAIGSFAGRVIDPPPFNWLQTILAVLALAMTLLILATQRRAAQLAAVREQLTLQIALSAEQKTAKIIELLADMQRKLPWTDGHVDEELKAMAAPADPAVVISAIEPLVSPPRKENS